MYLQHKENEDNLFFKLFEILFYSWKNWIKLTLIPFFIKTRFYYKIIFYYKLIFSKKYVNLLYIIK